MCPACLCFQSKKNAAADVEQRKFDGTGYDSDLVDALERDIVSRNPNIHWYCAILALVLLFKYLRVYSIQNKCIYTIVLLIYHNSI